MRIFAASFLALCLGPALFGQLRGVRGSLGSVVYPAGAPGTPGVTRTGSSVVNPGGGGVHLISPIGPHKEAAPVRRNNFWGYPVYIGGYYEAPYVDPAAATPAQPNITVVMPPQAPAAPVIINNYYPASGSAAPDQPQPAMEEVATTPEPTHYLLAFKDHTIYNATAYWVDGDTLHYFTAGNTHNQVSLALVDRDFTQKLNKEAGVEVKLPAPPK